VIMKRLTRVLTRRSLMVGISYSSQRAEAGS